MNRNTQRGRRGMVIATKSHRAELREHIAAALGFILGSSIITLAVIATAVIR